ncbi:hypothetical protein [Mycobacterium talmoniae]|uniref:Uncharacterized protein n=1 Tax=Mycobacterium talmoniae TaxID=1858794 RepID=A0A1S1NKF7_9MYCO|nr:hypothetical protein [Mycobacterium talmoniae]OHV06748.1 hypothetical protein BKN37_00645 [Mycobacterium talmoniae]
MTAHVFGLADLTPTPQPRTNDDSIGYRLDVVASSVVEVVGAAGGWLYDRRAAGWQVNVFLPGTADRRPLQILGVGSWALDDAFASGPVSGRALAVSAALVAGDARIRDMVRAALNNTRASVTLWGDDWPVPVDRTMQPAHHRLSAAARAFKQHALTAAGAAHRAVDPAEAFLSDLTPCRAVDADLIPLAR